MARQPSKTLIGAFVVGAVALAVLGIAAFGSGRLFQKHFTCVMYFSGSITGLSIGSPVEFRGVKIGQVTKIAAVFDPKAVTVHIPVYIEVDPKSLVVLGDEDASKVLATNHFYEPLLEKGLKARLDIESFVTGKLYISMDFHPGPPAAPRTRPAVSGDPHHPLASRGDREDAAEAPREDHRGGRRDRTAGQFPRGAGQPARPQRSDPVGHEGRSGL
jgi:hypothetical protein